MHMRYSLVALPLSLLVSLPGCATGPRVIPAGGVPQAVAAANGVSLVVSDEEWDGSPGDLNDYITAIPVELTNTGSTEVRVSYFDFALVDEAGFRYKALNPFQTTVGSLDTPSNEGRASQFAASVVGAKPVALASLDGSALSPPLVATLYPEESAPYAGVMLAGPGRGVRIAPPPPPRAPGFGGFSHPRGFSTPRTYYNPYRYPTRNPWFGWRAGYEFGHWRGYRVLPGYRPWFGPGFGFYWSDPLFWPPGYNAWVLGWGSFGYPRYPTVPQDVVRLALPEGVLQPGGHVAGYLYFQHAKPGVRNLMLTWDMAEARQGSALGQAQVQLEVVQ